MKYNNSSKFQYEDYSSILELLKDAVETAKSEVNKNECINILSDKETTEYILHQISSILLDGFDFNIDYVDITDSFDRFITTIYADGSVYIDKAYTNDYEKCVQLDGILFADSEIDKQFYCDLYNDIVVFNF